MFVYTNLAITGLEIAIGVLYLAVGLVVGWYLSALATGNTLRRAKSEAEQVTRAAEAEAEAIKQRVELDAERKATKRREELDKEVAAAMADLKRDQERLAGREEKLDARLEKINEQQGRLEKRDAQFREREQQLASEIQDLERERGVITERLQEVSGMTVDDARERLLADVRRDSEHEATILTQQILDQAEVDAHSRSREITLQAIQRFAAEHVADSTVRSVRIPSDGMKGRIIGREGRNIRALERATGVDILVDDTPGVIAVSCFDPIRRAVAAESLQKLVADGRVHPSRVEEIVERVRTEMQERIIKYGNDAVVESNIRGLNPKIIEAMGKLHFRTSYGQNVLRHSIEVAYLSQIIADQLGLDPAVARRCGFLHDIGKAMDHEMEGGHPAIGMEFCAKHGEKSDTVLNAIGGHHGDIPATSSYTPIVMAADAISGARPGARRESMEMYIKRLEQLEGIAKELDGVAEAHAIQAGREVRVIVDAKAVDDATAFTIARSIARKVEEEMTFPGEIKVTVLREVRAEATAR
ncbi:MAG: ribonuclease Y [Planctomycetota bacterium]